jgi:NDP-sugar pyrophosphorylase family protein
LHSTLVLQPFTAAFFENKEYIVTGEDILVSKWEYSLRAVGRGKDMSAANQFLPEGLVLDIQVEVDRSSQGSGNVQSGRGAVLRRSYLVGPGVIGECAVLENAIVGPHVSIGDNVSIRRSHLENVIVLDGATIVGSGMIENSLIGRSTQIDLGESEFGSSFILGDHCCVNLGTRSSQGRSYRCERSVRLRWGFVHVGPSLGADFRRKTSGEKSRQKVLRQVSAVKVGYDWGRWCGHAGEGLVRASPRN